MHTMIAVALRPLIFGLFLLMAWGIARLLNKAIPEGRIKTWLYKPRKF
jgi:hypothetical protein